MPKRMPWEHLYIGDTNKVFVVDIGARSGVSEIWRDLMPCTHIVGFEPDADAYAALADEVQPANETYDVREYFCDLQCRRPTRKSFIRPVTNT